MIPEKYSDLFRFWRVAFLCIFLHCIDSTHVSIPASVLHQRSSPEMNTMSPSLTRFSLNSCPVLSFSSLLLLFPNGYTAETNLNSLFCCFFLLSDQVWVVDLIAVCYKAKLLSPVSLLLLSFSFTFSFMFGFWKRHLLEGALQAQCRPRRSVSCGLDAIYELRPRSYMWVATTPLYG